MIKVVYLARLRDALGTSSEHLPAAQNVAELLVFLKNRGGVWAQELAEGKAYKVAVNHALANMQTPLKSGDEVALLPPVTGG
jgi:sulfur-carrier protein